MSIRIEIELTSSTPDGSWTWRAAGAREPRGVLDGSILPQGAAVGDTLRVETEKDMDGTRVLSVVPGKEKAARSDVLELIPSDKPFEPVIQQRVTRDRDDRRPRRDGRDGPGGGDRRDRNDRGRSDRGPRRDGEPGGGRPGGDRPGGGGGGRGAPGDRNRGPSSGDRDRGGSGGPGGSGDDRRRQRPHFTPPPEVPQRPKPKRLRPGKQHRTEVLESLPEEQRTIAELALQGIAAVRQRLREDNVRLKAEGKPEMPEAAVLRMAEALIPRLRVADWLDRADAAQRQMEHLDLRDLRSVVAASDDPSVARDESTRELATALKAALVTKQDEELTLWLSDVEAALDVGRVVRALRLSSVPPKAGVPFPGALATRLAEATTASLQPGDGPDRWSAVLEAAAFSPIRSLVTPAAAPEQRSDELVATVRRLGPLLPQVAALFEIEVPAGAAVPKPLRPTTRRPEAKKAAPKAAPRPPAPRTQIPPPPSQAERDEAAADAEPTAAADEPVETTPVADTEPTAATDEPVETTPVADTEPTAATDEPVETTPVADTEPTAATDEPVDDRTRGR